jgi:hypothetical protein
MLDTTTTPCNESLLTREKRDTSWYDFRVERKDERMILLSMKKLVFNNNNNMIEGPQ